MIRLAIDTSSALSSVAVSLSDGRTFERESPSRDSHSTALEALTKQTLADAGIESFAQISSLVIGLGPGSFTGLRIGLSFAKGISWAHRIPLSGVSSYRAMAQSGMPSGESIAVVGDARRDEYFFGSWHVEEGELIEDRPLSILSLTELASYLSDMSELTIIDAGNESLPACRHRVIAARSVARGLLKAPIQPESWSIGTLTGIEPIYLRQVAALTIEDRRQRGLL